MELINLQAKLAPTDADLQQFSGQHTGILSGDQDIRDELDAGIGDGQE
jgi:hypothetical protein